MTVDYLPALLKTHERMNRRHAGAFLVPPPANDGWSLKWRA